MSLYLSVWSPAQRDATLVSIQHYNLGKILVMIVTGNNKEQKGFFLNACRPWA